MMNIPEKDFQKHFDILDFNRDGGIDLNEFKVWFKLKERFDSWDLDQNGTLEKNEFKTVLEELFGYTENKMSPENF